MATEFMDCERRFYGKQWGDHITIMMYNMGQFGEDHYCQHLTILKAKELAEKLNNLIAMGD